MSGRAGKPLDWTRAARREYLAQLGWIAAENPLAAELVRQRIEHSLDLIRLQPGLGTPDQRQRRRHSVPRTPFTVYYRETARSIQVLRILHHAQSTANRLR